MIKISILKEIIWNDKMTASFQREIGIQLSTIKNMKMYKEMLSEVLLHSFVCLKSNTSFKKGKFFNFRYCEKAKNFQFFKLLTVFKIGVCFFKLCGLLRISEFKSFVAF